tara:strand:- start:405 stop:731 length:327 start_codon:yes stop_codon:yes gene_type:complete
MAVIDTDATELPNHKKVTLSGTPNTMQEFSIPGKAERVEIQFEGATVTGKVVFNGGTDGAVISGGVIAYPVPGDSSFYYGLGRSKQKHSIWIASDTASTVAHVIVYEA